MPSYVFAKKNAAFVMYVGLVSQADTKVFQSNPTLATGDAKVSIDGSALDNLDTLPDVDPNSSKLVKISLSSDEMNGDNIQVILSDAAGSEWCDLILNIQTTTRQVDDLAFPVTSGHGLDVTATGAAGIDWGNVENQSTAVDLSATQILSADAVGVVALIGADGIDGDSLSAAALTDIQGAVNAALTATVPDSVPADGTRPSVASGIYMLTQMMMEKSLSGVTMTVKKPDGTTALMTFTLNDSTTPTSITRAS